MHLKESGQTSRTICAKPIIPQFLSKRPTRIPMGCSENTPKLARSQDFGAPWTPRETPPLLMELWPSQQTRQTHKSVKLWDILNESRCLAPSRRWSKGGRDLTILD
jgi:hypothetical protein